MRILLTLLAIAAAGALVFFAIGGFEEAPNLGDPDAASNDGQADGGDARLLAGAPAKEPALVRVPLGRPTVALLLARRPTTGAQFLAQTLSDIAKLNFATWFTESDDVRNVKAGAGAGPNRGIELDAQPTAEDLKTLAIDVLILDDIDPNVFPGAFWEAVVQRVGAGKMGLWVHPGFPVGAEGSTQTAHPMLSHPALASLLPVAEAEQLAGSPVPGTFGKEGAALLLTDDGAKHAASRLSPYPKWARHTWRNRQAGQGSWRPNFVYPITKLAPGATSLVDVEISSIERRPAIAVSSTDVGRVLWQGNFDFGHKTYFDPSAIGPVGVWVHGVVLWLAGQSK